MESTSAGKHGSDFIFDSEKGFNIAVALSSFEDGRISEDGQPAELDVSYGQIVFNHYKWGPTADDDN